MASPPRPNQLHIVGLCDETIVVEWHVDDTVLDIKRKAFDAAASTILPDGTRHSLVNGVTCELIAPYYWEKFTNVMSVKDCNKINFI